jgi:alcohol dehydrogenase class IV
MERCTLPQGIFHGPPWAPEPQNPLERNKVVVVVDGGALQGFGFLEQALACLKHMGMEVETFEDSNPSE